jgi:hypothetical protein
VFPFSISFVSSSSSQVSNSFSTHSYSIPPERGAYLPSTHHVIFVKKRNYVKSGKFEKAKLEGERVIKKKKLQRMKLDAPQLQSLVDLKKAALPKIIKSDIRRDYFLMFANVLNSFDFPLITSFFQRFFHVDTTLSKLSSGSSRPLKLSSSSSLLSSSFSSSNSLLSAISPSSTVSHLSLMPSGGPHVIKGIDFIILYFIFLLRVGPDRVTRVSDIQLKQSSSMKDGYCELCATYEVSYTRFFEILSEQILPILLPELLEETKTFLHSEPSSSSRLTDKIHSSWSSVPLQFNKSQQSNSTAKCRRGEDGAYQYSLTGSTRFMELQHSLLTSREESSDTKPNDEQRADYDKKSNEYQVEDKLRSQPFDVTVKLKYDKEKQQYCYSKLSVLSSPSAFYMNGKISFIINAMKQIEEIIFVPIIATVNGVRVSNF